MKTGIAIVAIVVIALGNGAVLAIDYTFNVPQGDWSDTGSWEPPETLDIGSQQEPYPDPVYVVTAKKNRGGDASVSPPCAS